MVQGGVHPPGQPPGIRQLLSSSSTNRQRNLMIAATPWRKSSTPNAPSKWPPGRRWSSWQGRWPAGEAEVEVTFMEVGPNGGAPAQDSPVPESPGAMRSYTDIGRFLAMFENGKLAFDLFHCSGRRPAGLSHKCGSIPAFAGPLPAFSRTLWRAALPSSKCRSSRRWLSCWFT